MYNLQAENTGCRFNNVRQDKRGPQKSSSLASNPPGRLEYLWELAHAQAAHFISSSHMCWQICQHGGCRTVGVNSALHAYMFLPTSPPCLLLSSSQKLNRKSSPTDCEQHRCLQHELRAALFQTRDECLQQTDHLHRNPCGRFTDVHFSMEGMSLWV